MPQQDFTKFLNQMEQMGLIEWNVRLAEGIEEKTLIEILRSEGYCRFANMLQKKIVVEKELEEVAR
ncbi:MAG: hypothetical protein PVS3B3_33480 [Ktedonobacteraceae bacterium]